VTDFESVELAAAVRAVRDELVRASADAEGETVRFDVGEIEMEFAVELRHDAGAKGGFKAWVVSADADARTSRARTHRVAFTLTPRNAVTGRGVEIGADSPGKTGDFGSVGDAGCGLPTERSRGDRSYGEEESRGDGASTAVSGTEESRTDDAARTE
jgi:hypothetical protein